MFKHLLVPLDGSKLAEVSLPVAAQLCRQLGARVTLIHVIEKDAPQMIHGERHLTCEEDACRYLEEVGAQYFPADQVQAHVHTEKVQNVAASIVDHSGELAPDLIVMCAHGAGGWHDLRHDLVVGSMAQQVIGRGKTPILLLQSGAGRAADLKKILVALDEEPEHAGALAVAAGLAQSLGAALHLLTVVHTLGTLPGERAASGWMLPGATRTLLDMQEEESAAHLEQLAADWRRAGLTVTTEVRRGDPAQQIVMGGTAARADWIVLTTHGKAGMGAFWAGSVGSKVVAGSMLPLLLIPVKK